MSGRDNGSENPFRADSTDTRNRWWCPSGGEPIFGQKFYFQVRSGESMADSKSLSAIRKHDDLRIPVDGSDVAATRYEPIDQDGPSPALLMYIPYHKDGYITYGAYNPLIRYLSKHGYEVVVADMVGTGASGGVIEEMFVRREGRETAELVEWLAKQPWTNGNVGVFGKSYGGITALDGAAQRPDGLETIIPIHTPFHGWRNSYTQEGLFELLTIGMEWLSHMQLLDVKPPSRRDDDGRWFDLWEDRLEAARNRDPWLIQFLNHSTKDQYWQDKDIPVGKIETPTLAIGGWRDPYIRDTVEYFERIDASKRMILGPWRHTMPHRGRETAIDFRRLLVDWCDRFLKNQGPSTIDEPTVTVWTERNGGGRADDGFWQGLEHWPDVSSDQIRSFALSEAGLTDLDEYENGPVERTYEIDHTVGLASTTPSGPDIRPPNTADDDSRSVCFESDSLSRAHEYTGTGAATIRLRSSVPEPTLSVRVIDVAPDGRGTLVTHGSSNLSSAESLSSPEPLDPKAEHEFTVPLLPKSHVFERGHRIRIAIGGAYFPEYMPTEEHGSFTLLSTPADPSVLSLPVRPFDVDTVGLHEFGEPDRRIPVSSRFADGDSSWETGRKHGSERGWARKTADKTVDLPTCEMEMTEEHRASVGVRDPDSVRVRNTSSMKLRYDVETVRIQASSRITGDTVGVTTTVTVDDETLLDRSWFDTW